MRRAPSSLQTHGTAVAEGGAAEADEGRHDRGVRQHLGGLRRWSFLRQSCSAPRGALRPGLQHHGHLQSCDLGPDAHQGVRAGGLHLRQHPAQQGRAAQLEDGVQHGDLGGDVGAFCFHDEICRDHCDHSKGARLTSSVGTKRPRKPGEESSRTSRRAAVAGRPQRCVA